MFVIVLWDLNGYANLYTNIFLNLFSLLLLSEILNAFIKKIGLQSKHKFYHIYKSSYMFRLHICSHHMAEYQTLNKKTLKWNIIVLYFLLFQVLYLTR